MSDFVNSDINLTGTLISLLALMDKPQSLDFLSSTDPTFILQNIFATNANNMLQMKGYVPSIQVKDMGKALATHICTCMGSGFDNTQDERTIQTDLLARIFAYAAMELNTEVADYMVASHGSTILLIIYREIQEDWDFLGNSDNFLLTNTTKTIQDDLDEAFTNRQHKNIMSITTPVSQFSSQDKHTIIDSIVNETPLPEKWAFVDEKGHKCVTYGWLSGNDIPKKSIPPSTSFSLTIGQKCPLEMDHNMENITHVECLEAIKHHLPLPQLTIKANCDAWTITTNNCLDICRSKYPDINPTTNWEKGNISSTASVILQDPKIKWPLKILRKNSPDLAMEDVTRELSKIDIIRKMTTIWKDMVKTMWKENILTCNQATLDQATHLLLLEDTTHKYAQMTQGQIYDTEIDQRDQIIACITALNENVSKAIADIKWKSIPTKDQDKISLITLQGWEMVKRTILQNPSKFFPDNIPSSQRA
ncbi:hypothetical protein AMATHDRAFT_6844 [Amanita thiersii Skay4041]|uniref:Uncharacterized protein n=1 Tax=Amanita thiersii Skay4041 TaxID=703135 RepID=A0A2A9NGF7_9AGAR|nr:hypothetical protein AMATHDRAFT_6844 [Amanita thiersii Skay4041]